MSGASSQRTAIRRFLLRAGAIVVINIMLAWGILCATGAYRSYEQWETDSVLYATPRNTTFDFLSLGTSRARIFSEFKDNHDFVVNDLGLHFLNLAIPFGGGILPERLYLENFYERGNRAKAVVLFLDPFVLFSNSFNLEHRFVYYEPFRARFLAKLIVNRLPFERIMTYVRSKFGRYWFERVPTSKPRDERVVDIAHANPDDLRKRMDSLYPEGVNEVNFARYTRDVTRIVDMAAHHDSRVFIVFLPTLLPPEPGYERAKAFLDGCRAQHPFTFCDWKNALNDPRLFADHDHLNYEGFQHLTRDLLQPMLAGP